MAGMRFNPEKLAKLLQPHGFLLNLPEAMKHGISFIRPSSAERLYDHILINASNPVYAETVISAASSTSCRECVSQRDNRLRAFLAPGAPYHNSWVHTAAEAKSWQKRLVENADAFCVAAATAKGPLLTQRLQPVFNAVDAYMQRLGNLFEILDREFAFFSEAAPDERSQAEQLARLAHEMLWLDSEDSKLASLALIRFGTEVEGRDSPFHGKVPHRDSGLATRLILLADYIRRKRADYADAGGLYR
jgi:hypothetical protein